VTRHPDGGGVHKRERHDKVKDARHEVGAAGDELKRRLGIVKSPGACGVHGRAGGVLAGIVSARHRYSHVAAQGAYQKPATIVGGRDRHRAFLSGSAVKGPYDFDDSTRREKWRRPRNGDPGQLVPTQSSRVQCNAGGQKVPGGQAETCRICLPGAMERISDRRDDHCSGVSTIVPFKNSSTGGSAPRE